MPYQGFPDGIYLLSRASSAKPLKHYAILDIGNLLGFINADGTHPVVLHQTPPQIRFDWLQDTGVWDVIGRVTDEADVLHRLHLALQYPDYALFQNNCEHFARFVSTGVHESRQVNAAVLSLGHAALVYTAYSEA